MFIKIFCFIKFDSYWVTDIKKKNTLCATLLGFIFLL